VSNLDPNRVQLNRSEQVNVAGALTANITNTPGFERNNPNPSNISIAASQSGDRVFAINGQNPGAPNAVYTSVDLNQARTQPLEVSSAQAVAPTQVPVVQTPTPPVQSQPQPEPTGGVPRVN
jgi:hypothetical protein